MLCYGSCCGSDGQGDRSVGITHDLDDRARRWPSREDSKNLTGECQRSGELQEKGGEDAQTFWKARLWLAKMVMTFDVMPPNSRP